MTRVKNERGIALVMVLVMSAITLAIMAQLIYFVTQGTRISGIERRYKTALEASTGGADISYDFVNTRGTPASLANLLADIAVLGPVVTTPVTCVPSGAAECISLSEYDATYTGLETKLKLPTNCWSSCDSSVSIDPGAAGTYDISLQLGAGPVYDVFMKIVDATYGNSGAPTGLIKTGVVLADPNEKKPKQILYLYTVEVLSQNSVNPLERAKTSILYGY